MLGFQPIAAAPLASLDAGEDIQVSAGVGIVQAGGGAFGPAAARSAKHRFRVRKDKSRPKVITVRIGDWPENPQIILERQEESEREAFHRSLANRRDEVVAEYVDEDEQALMEIFAFAA